MHSWVWPHSYVILLICAYIFTYTILKNNIFLIMINNNKVLYSVCQQIWKTQQWPQD